MQWKSDTLSNY